MFLTRFFFISFLKYTCIYIFWLRFFFDNAESVLKNFIFLQAYYNVDNSFMFNIN